MTVQVINPGNKQDDGLMGLIGSALNVATNVYKVKMDNKALDAANKIKQAEAEKTRANQLSDAETKAAATVAEKFAPVPKGTLGSVTAQQLGLSDPPKFGFSADTAFLPRSDIAKDKELGLKKELAAQKETKGKSVGSDALDKDFAKEYSSYVAQGGSAAVAENLKQLREVANKLKATDSATGPVIGMLPKFARDVVTPDGAALQDRLEEVVQSNMKLALGAQFTEKEGRQVMERAWNPRLSEEENARRVEALITKMQDAATAREQAMAYFEQNGTLQGFKGRVYTKQDFMLDPNDGKTAIAGSNAGGATSPGSVFPAAYGDSGFDPDSYLRGN